MNLTFRAGGTASAARLPRFVAAFRCRCERLWLRGLRRVFGFDAWHVSASYSCRPYKRKVVELVNSLRPTTVVEVGCGLGDILRRVHAAERYGFDVDSAVIRAAHFLHPAAACWIHGDASAVALALPAGRRIDCLVMVNWIHNLSPQQLAAQILPLVGRTSYLIVDAIDPDGPRSYRFKHDFSFLATCAQRLSSNRASGEPRSFILFKMTP